MVGVKTTKNITCIKRVAFYVFVSLFAIGQIFPLIWLINFSLLKSNDFFTSEILKFPNPPQLENYITAWVNGKIPQYLFNSVFVTSSTIAITGILSLTLGFAFTRMQWKLRSICFAVMLLGMMIPIHSTLLPNFVIFSEIGLLNTYMGLIIPYAAFSLPMGIFIMSGFMKTIPKSLEESAIIDGCGIYEIIFKIILPITKPALVTITVITFLNCWNEFIMAATYISDNFFKTLPFSVINFEGQYSSNYAVQFAVMTLTAIPAILIYIALNEHITKGVTAGALKG